MCKDRDSILKKARDCRPEGLLFKEDFSTRVIQTRKNYQPQLERLRAEGKIAYLSYNKLIVRGSAPGSYPRQDAPQPTDPSRGAESTPSLDQDPLTSSSD